MAFTGTISDIPKLPDTSGYVESLTDVMGASTITGLTQASIKLGVEQSFLEAANSAAKSAAQYVQSGARR